ncbi:MAG TPA: M48 family metallopeptidase [Trueperaceae bacterium]|nr:M48 family metallopeptidase [Trueperaceae bacterium]
MSVPRSAVLPNVITDRATGRRISLLDWQAANRRLSWLLGVIMAALLGAIGYLLAQVTNPASAGFFVAVAGVLGAGQTAVAYWFSDQLALGAAGARPATKDEYRYLVDVTEAVAIGAGVPTPHIYVIDSPAPNAFATGRDPQHASIAVTRGLIDMLDRQELEGVVAHEMSHVKNYDIRFMSMLAATVGVIVILRDLVLRWFQFGEFGGSRRSRSDRGNNRGQGIMVVLLVVLLVLGPILATILRLAVSRRREFLADATGAYITRNPEGLASALGKLAAYQGEGLEVSEGVRHLFIVNPLARHNAVDIFATHPPIQERIDRLHRM